MNLSWKLKDKNNQYRNISPSKYMRIEFSQLLMNVNWLAPYKFLKRGNWKQVSSIINLDSIINLE